MADTVVTEDKAIAEGAHASKAPLNERPFGKLFAKGAGLEKKEEPVKAAAPMPEGGEVPKTEVKEEPKAETPKEEAKQPISLLDAFNKATGTKPGETPKPEGTPSDKETNFAQLRTAKEALEAKVKELEARVPSDYETIKKEYSSLKERNTIVEAELKKVALEKTPDFQEKYDKKIASKLGSIERALIGSDVEKGTILEAIQQPEGRQRNQALSDAMESLDPLTKAKISGAIAEYDSLRESRQAELANPDASLKLQKEQEESFRKAQIEATHKVIEDTIGKAEKVIPWFKESEDASWNQVIQGVKEQARNYWKNPSTVQDQSEVAFSAALMPVLNKLLIASQQENQRLQEDLAKLRGSTPKNGGTPPADPSTKPIIGKGAFNAAFKKAMTTTH